MYAVNQYDAVAESYDSLFKDKASIEENRKIASMLLRFQGFFWMWDVVRGYSLIF